MQDFLAFINYKKEPISLEEGINQTTLNIKNDDFNLTFSSTTNPSKVLNNQKLFIFLYGTLSNQTALSSLLGLSKKPHSTMELLARAYLYWGLEFIKELEGSFSLVLYNKEQQVLILAKDRVGKRPLNFYHSNDTVIFSSHIRRFKEVKGFNPKINPQSLASYLQFGAILQPNTILEDCYKVKSGHYNYFDLKKKEYFEKEYWSLEKCYHNPKVTSNEIDTIQKAKSLLQNSIDTTFPEDRNVAVSLSGGYDSSTLVALIQEQSSRKLNTFTIGFRDESINEAVEAKAIAKHLGTDHHEHYFRATDALEIVPKLSEIYDEPFAEYAGTPTVLTAQLLKFSGIKDIFVGDGGDEVFATADDTTFFQRIHTIPHKLRDTILSPCHKIPVEKIPYLENFNNLPTKYKKLFQILSSKNIPKTIEARNILFREDELQLLIQNYNTPIQTTFDEIDFNGYNETVDEIIGTYFKTTMTDGELVKSYGAMNYHNIELHTPFLDEQLIEYMATVPASIKIKDGVKKHILKEIAHHYIPKQLLNRPKSGFDIPFSLWMRKELKMLVYEEINEQRLNQDKLFYTSSIIKIRDNFYNGNDSFKYKLWRILIFQLWYKNFKG